MSEDILKFLESKKPFIDDIIRKYIPEKIDEGYVEWAFGKARYAYDVDALNKSIAEPLWDFLNRGGKRWRPALFLLVAEALGADIEKIKDFAVVPELIHNGSIMTDDVEDMGEMRRGKPCTHKIFGTDIAINTGNMMYFLPLLSFIKNKDKFDAQTLLRAYDAYSEEMINISLGQATDIWWHKGRKDNITKEQYLQMCANKTGCLSRLSARLAVILSEGTKEQEEKLGNFAEILGIAFQIQDDTLSVIGDKFAAKKGYGDDITEGKRSLIVIHALEKASNEDKEKLISILDEHTRDPEKISKAIEILKKYGSVEYAKELARNLMKKAWEDINPLLPESDAKKKIKALADFSIEREI